MSLITHVNNYIYAAITYAQIVSWNITGHHFVAYMIQGVDFCEI